MSEGTPIVVPQRAPILSAAFAPLFLLVVVLAAADLPGDFADGLYRGLVVGLLAIMALCVVRTKRRARRPSLELLANRLRAVDDGGVREQPLEGVSRVLFDRGARWPMLMSRFGAFFGEPNRLPTVCVFGEPYDDSYREQILGPGMTRLARWLDAPESPERGKVLLVQEIHTLGPRGVNAAQRTVRDWCDERGITFEVHSGWLWGRRKN